jgi:hypothetical protein
LCNRVGQLAAAAGCRTVGTAARVRAWKVVGACAGFAAAASRIGPHTAREAPVRSGRPEQPSREQSRAAGLAGQGGAGVAAPVRRGRPWSLEAAATCANTGLPDSHPRRQGGVGRAARRPGGGRGGYGSRRGRPVGGRTAEGGWQMRTLPLGVPGLR